MRRQREREEQKLGEPLFYFDDAKMGQQEITIYASECNQVIVTFDPERTLTITELKIVDADRSRREENAVE